MWLVVGLGNPGGEYQGNRHNVGFTAADELARRAGAAAPKHKFGAQVAEGVLAGHKVLFCKPMEYMNTSGQAVARVAQFWKVPPERTLVMHDDLDLPFGRLKLGVGGGHGGHNGLKSLIEGIGPEFVRVRIGIGRPPVGWDPADYVLADFTQAEQRELPEVVYEAAAAALAIVATGLVKAMNKFNVKKLQEDVK